MFKIGNQIINFLLDSFHGIVSLHMCPTISDGVSSSQEGCSAWGTKRSCSNMLSEFYSFLCKTVNIWCPKKNRDMLKQWGSKLRDELETNLKQT